MELQPLLTPSQWLSSVPLTGGRGNVPLILTARWVPFGTAPPEAGLGTTVVGGLQFTFGAKVATVPGNRPTGKFVPEGRIKRSCQACNNDPTRGAQSTYMYNGTDTHMYLYSAKEFPIVSPRTLNVSSSMPRNPLSWYFFLRLQTSRLTDAVSFPHRMPGNVFQLWWDRGCTDALLSTESALLGFSFSLQNRDSISKTQNPSEN